MDRGAPLPVTSTEPAAPPKRGSTAIIVAVLTAWSFFVYRHGLYALPRGDQLPFLDERARFPETGAWLLHTLSYTRTRFLTGDGHYMFRPLHGFVLGSEEVLFRDDALAQGLLSIGLHTAVVLVLYFLVRWVADPVVAFLASVVYATEYPGMEMVLWRHISPYMLAPLFLGLGLHALRRAWTGMGAWPGAVPWLLLACLTHEAVAIAFVFALAAALIARRRSVDRSRLDAVSRALAVAIILWLFLDALDLVLHPNAAMVASDGALLPDFSLVRAVTGLLQFLGLCMVAMLAPSVVDLRWNGPERAFSRLQWDYTAVPEALTLTVGIATFVLLLATVVSSSRRLARGDATGLAPLLLASFALAVALAFTAVRTSTRSFGYFANATYYCHLTAFVFLVLGSPALAAARTSRLRVPVTWGAAALAALWSLTSYVCVQQALLAQEPFVRLALSTAATVRQTLDGRPDLCIGGVIDAAAREAVAPPRGPLTLLGATACAYRKSARGVYLDRVGGTYGLVSLPPPEDLRAVSVDPTPAWIVDSPAVTARPGTADTVSIFSSQVVRPTEVDVRVENGQDGGLWVGHRSVTSHTAIAFFAGAHVVGRVRDGDAPAAARFEALAVIADSSFDLRVRVVGDHALVFYDDTLIGDLGNVDLAGRVGLFHHAAGPRPQVFHDLRVGEAIPPRPVVEVPLDLRLEGLADALARLSN
jgi:hypothetical protein